VSVFGTSDRSTDEEPFYSVGVLGFSRHMRLEACHIDYPLGELTAYAGHS